MGLSIDGKLPDGRDGQQWRDKRQSIRLRAFPERNNLTRIDSRANYYRFGRYRVEPHTDHVSRKVFGPYNKQWLLQDWVFIARGDTLQGR
jgi:hypothetical protein